MWPGPPFTPITHLGGEEDVLKTKFSNLDRAHGVRSRCFRPLRPELKPSQTIASRVPEQYNRDMEMAMPLHLFWDTDQADPGQHPAYIIERVLEHGRKEDAEWLFRQYDRQTIAEVVKKSRRLSPKSRNYWGIMLGLWKQLPPSARQPAKIWKY